MKKVLKILLLLLIVLLIIVLSNFNISSFKSKESGITLKIPSLSKYDKECCSYSVSFKSLKSVKKLKNDLANIMNEYEKVSCNNHEYYYNSNEDYTITDYGVENKIINTFYINYVKGNPCKYEYINKYPIIQNISADYTKEEAIKDGYYIIADGKIYNKSMYTEFMDNVSKEKNAFLRAITFTTEGDMIITDIDYNEKFSITIDYTRDEFSSKEDRIYKKYSFDNIGIYEDKLYAYNGKELNKDIISSNDSLVLFSMK